MCEKAQVQQDDNPFERTGTDLYKVKGLPGQLNQVEDSTNAPSVEIQGQRVSIGTEIRFTNPLFEDVKTQTRDEVFEIEEDHLRMKNDFQKLTFEYLESDPGFSVINTGTNPGTIKALTSLATGAVDEPVDQMIEEDLNLADELKPLGDETPLTEDQSNPTSDGNKAEPDESDSDAPQAEEESEKTTDSADEPSQELHELMMTAEVRYREALEAASHLLTQDEQVQAQSEATITRIKEQRTIYLRYNRDELDPEQLEELARLESEEPVENPTPDETLAYIESIQALHRAQRSTDSGEFEDVADRDDEEEESVTEPPPPPMVTPQGTLIEESHDAIDDDEDEVAAFSREIEEGGLVEEESASGGTLTLGWAKPSTDVIEDEDIIKTVSKGLEAIEEGDLDGPWFQRDDEESSLEEPTPDDASDEIESYSDDTTAVVIPPEYNPIDPEPHHGEGSGPLLSPEELSEKYSDDLVDPYSPPIEGGDKDTEVIEGWAFGDDWSKAPDTTGPPDSNPFSEPARHATTLPEPEYHLPDPTPSSSDHPVLDDSADDEFLMDDDDWDNDSTPGEWDDDGDAFCLVDTTIATMQPAPDSIADTDEQEAVEETIPSRSGNTGIISYDSIPTKAFRPRPGDEDHRPKSKRRYVWAALITAALAATILTIIYQAYIDDGSETQEGHNQDLSETTLVPEGTEDDSAIANAPATSVADLMPTIAQNQRTATESPPDEPDELSSTPAAEVVQIAQAVLPEGDDPIEIELPDFTENEPSDEPVAIAQVHDNEVQGPIPPPTEEEEEPEEEVENQQSAEPLDGRPPLTLEDAQEELEDLEEDVEQARTRSAEQRRRSGDRIDSLEAQGESSITLMRQISDLSDENEREIERLAQANIDLTIRVAGLEADLERHEQDEVDRLNEAIGQVNRSISGLRDRIDALERARGTYASLSDLESMSSEVEDLAGSIADDLTSLSSRIESMDGEHTVSQEQIEEMIENLESISTDVQSVSTTTAAPERRGPSERVVNRRNRAEYFREEIPGRLHSEYERFFETDLYRDANDAEDYYDALDYCDNLRHESTSLSLRCHSFILWSRCNARGRGRCALTHLD